LAGDFVSSDIAVAVLVVAKAPVPGLAKTRLAATLGTAVAADLAAAALLDTLDSVADAPVAHRVVAMTGDLAAASRCEEIRTRLADFTVVEQRGDDFADRLANAHADAASAAGGLPVVQIGMDTPQVTAALLAECAVALLSTDAVLGMARDGGWWVLGLTDPQAAECLRTVPMSTAQTGAVTLAALRDTGLDVQLLPELADVDTVDDIEEVRRMCAPDSRFRQASVAVEVGRAG
jgi:rSAM/selenodomain-associated transferase 1